MVDVAGREQVAASGREAAAIVLVSLCSSAARFRPLHHLLPPRAHMNLARHSISATAHVVIFDTRLEPNCEIFATATPAGFAVYRTWPLQLLRNRGAHS